MERVKNVLIGASIILFILSGVLLIITVNLQPLQSTPVPQEMVVPATDTLLPTETFPPSTPLPTLTPSKTLRPPPTFEPPTLTPVPSATPSTTPSPTIQVGSDLEGIHGLETPTPSTTPGCKVRTEWVITYEVQPLDALERIAQQFGTTSWELAAGNCLNDANVIVVGQTLRVPGNPTPDGYIECVPWEVLTPIDHAFNIDGMGQLTFNWRGPNAPRNLIRVHDSDGEIALERVVDLRQNETINLPLDLPEEGIYTWYVYPLGMDFLQINCHEGGPWTFHIVLEDDE